MPVKKGSVKKQDGEYKRNGTCSIFIFTEPLVGWRHVAVSEHRTKKDWAEQMQVVLEQMYPDKGKIILVIDNFNTHTISSFYEKFKPDKARKLARRLEIHYTPKHGSWLNVAEIELSAMTTQRLVLTRAFLTWIHSAESYRLGNRIGIHLNRGLTGALPQRMPELS